MPGALLSDKLPPLVVANGDGQAAGALPLVELFLYPPAALWRQCRKPIGVESEHQRVDRGIVGVGHERLEGHRGAVSFYHRPETDVPDLRGESSRGFQRRSGEIGVLS